MIHAFLPKEKVKIIELDLLGTITAVRITEFGIEYLVRYFNDGTYNEIYMYDFEVAKCNA